MRTTLGRRARVGPWGRPEPARVPSKTVAIVIPAPVRPSLSADEQISLRHLRHFLGPYDKYLVAPEGWTTQYEGIRTLHVPKKFFGSLAANNNLDYWPGLYEAFADYKYMFWYHFDCLVFSDQLEDWCATDLDYIGPPWIKCTDSPWVDRPRVGNGGFALLKIESCLSALRARHAKEPATYWMDVAARNSHWIRPIVRVLQRVHRAAHTRVLGGLLTRWDRLEHPADHTLNSDFFWSDRAVRYVPEFKVASLEQGLRFGFEAGPRLCFEMNGGRMPFGCHAWARYDRKFWQPFLLPEAGWERAAS